MVTLTFKNQPIEVYIAGVVDYWPTLGYQQRPFFSPTSTTSRK